MMRSVSWQSLVSPFVIVLLSLINCGWGQDAGPAPKPAFVPKITISKETTWAIEPVDANGFVDYLAVINRRFGAGVTFENNAVVLFYRAIGPQPDGTRQPDEFFRQLGIEIPPDDGRYLERFLVNWPKEAMQAPWVTADFPWLAAWILAQQEPLRDLVEATERSEYFSPLVNAADEPLMEVRMPGVARSRELGRVLTARAMLKLGEGSRFDAWRDLIAAHRLGRLVGRGPTGIEGLVGEAIERQAMEGELRLILETQTPAKQVALFRRQLQRMPQRGSVADKIDSFERAMYLDSCIRLARRQMTIEEAAGGPLFEDAPLRPFFEEMLIRDVDWDEILRSLNRWFDRQATVSRMRSAKERSAAISEFRQDLLKLTQTRKKKQAWLVALADQASRTRFTADALASRFLSNKLDLQPFEDRVIQRTRNLEIALALSAWRGEHDSYPESLAELAPTYLESIPIDLFTDRPLSYERTADGYRFYSFGVNGKDDDGRGYEDKPEGDDLAVRMPLPKPKP